MLRCQRIILISGLLVFCSIYHANYAQAVQYLEYNNYGGTWYDAEKTWANDSYMCWAAGASNVLAYTGWGYPSSQSFNNSTDIFNYYKSHFTNNFGSPSPAMKWWFDGSTPWMFSSLVEPGGGFWNGSSVYENFSYGIRESGTALMQQTAAHLQAGDGVAMILGRNGAIVSHTVTVWGYDYELGTAQDISYTGIYITDSDDGVTGLRHYNLDLVNNRYYLDGLYGTSDYWYLSNGFALARNPDFNQSPVPIPSSLLLLGSGLVGLIGIGRRRFKK